MLNFPFVCQPNIFNKHIFCSALYSEASVYERAMYKKNSPIKHSASFNQWVGCLVFLKARSKLAPSLLLQHVNQLIQQEAYVANIHTGVHDVQQLVRNRRFLLTVVNAVAHMACKQLQMSALAVRYVVCANEWQAPLLFVLNCLSKQLHAKNKTGCSQCVSRVSISVEFWPHTNWLQVISPFICDHSRDCCYIQMER